MIAWVIVFSFLIPLVLSEFSEVSPWLARRILIWGARHVGDPAQSERYGEEWLAGIDGTPGKLTKLAKAVSIVCYAVPMVNWSINRNLYLWPVRRTADMLVAVIFPALACRLRERRLMSSYGIYAGSSWGFGLTTADLLYCVRSAPSVLAGRRALQKSETVNYGRLWVIFDHKFMRVVLHGSKASELREVKNVHVMHREFK